MLLSVFRLMDKGFYILCDLGITDLADKPRHFRLELPQLDIVVRSVYLTDRLRVRTTSPLHTCDGRFAFTFKDGLRDDKRAQQIADAHLATIELLYQIAAMPPDKAPLAHWLQNSLLHHGFILKTREISKCHPHLSHRLSFYRCYLPADIVDLAWKMLPVAIQQPYFDAIHFYQASIRKYCFIGDSITEILDGNLTLPQSRIDTVKAEDAVFNAFKAIEAIIGDPPKNEAKFHAKLREVGIEPDELVGYGSHQKVGLKETFAGKIRHFSDMRDKKAAHGRSASDRRITALDILEIQACAQAVIEIAIEKAMESQNAA